MTDVTSDVQAALVAPTHRFARFVTITLPDFTFRAWTGIGEKTIGAHTYVGTGDLGSIAPISDKSNLESQRVTMSLSGLDADLSAEARNYLHQGSPVEIIEAQLDASGAIIDDTYDIFIGEVDTMSETFGDTYSISCQVENFLSFMFRGPDGHRATAADQEALFPGDLGFQFVAQILPDIPWGQTNTISTVTSASGRRPRT